MSNLDNIPFSAELINMIREGHIDLIFEAHKDMISDQEQFDIYMNKMATAHTMVTMMAIEKDRADETDRPTKTLDSTEDSQVSESE